MNKPRIITQEEFLAMNTEAYLICRSYSGLLVRTNRDGVEIKAVLREYQIPKLNMEK